jgi:hypothetical protein
MNILNEPILPSLLIAIVMTFFILAWLTRHRPIVLSRSLSVNALCACGFAGAFVRAGWDKTVVAFLVIFVTSSLFSFARWAERRHDQPTVSPEEPS